MRSPMSRRKVILAAAISAITMGRPAFPDEVNDALESNIDASIRRALAWLAEEQQPSGAWTTNDFGESTATTSLAIMAMLAGGHVPDEGPYGLQITRGVGWLLGQQQKNGLLVGRERSHGPMYSHGIATLMLAEVIGMVNPVRQYDHSRGNRDCRAGSLWGAPHRRDSFRGEADTFSPAHQRRALLLLRRLLLYRRHVQSGWRRMAAMS